MRICARNHHKSAENENGEMEIIEYGKRENAPFSRKKKKWKWKMEKWALCNTGLKDDELTRTTVVLLLVQRKGLGFDLYRTSIQ